MRRDCLHGEEEEDSGGFFVVDGKKYLFHQMLMLWRQPS